MSSKSVKKFSWKNVTDVQSAKKAIDTGLLLDWSEAKNIIKILDSAAHEEIVSHMADRLGERFSDRLATEILIESLLIFMTTSGKEQLMVRFLECALNSDEFEPLARVFVEVSLSTEVGDDEREIALRSTAVALICELGFCIQNIEDETPGQLARGTALLDHIATYLLSVGNSSIPSVRLSLLRYFSTSEYGDVNKPGFSKIMTRFGHSIYDSLFQLLFNKKSEAIALQYLLDNLPTALEAVGDSQPILHETFKQYMLKYPEKFSLFMHEMGKRVISLCPSQDKLCSSAESYYKHLVALYKVTSDLDHRSLGREVLSEIFRFEELSSCMKFSQELQKSPQLRKSFRELVIAHRKEVGGGSKAQSIVSQFRLSKRGRKPTLNKKSEIGFLEQVLFLGQADWKKSAA